MNMSQENVGIDVVLDYIFGTTWLRGSEPDEEK